MRRLLFISLLGAALAAPSLAAAAVTPKPKTHGSGVTGTVVRVDGAKKILVVRAGPHETSLSMTPATSVHGGHLAAGQRVTVRWLEKDGKKVATSVRIEPPALAGATATPTAVVGGQP
ncbi:MAG TPA: hypothetical protein VH854_10240 [Thermoanaerobaculia bacterium]|jgi:hypothetical protein|nr:hypothetical protein [Thermoanaerobaculia bacterium]